MKKAFSLVELSIALVILGLLVGGILAGQSLIRASELRNVTTEAGRWSVAANAFKDKYFQIPGDFSKATDFWTKAHASPANCRFTLGAGAATCDGNGSGFFGDYNSFSNEAFAFWKHLASAGLITGNYTGIGSSTSSYDAIATTDNAPASKLSGAYWVTSTYNGAGTGSLFTHNYGNYLQIGALSGSATFLSSNILLPEEAWNIDQKIDDGLPNQGRIIASYNSNTCPIATGIADGAATYRLSSTTKACSLYFINMF